MLTAAQAKKSCARCATTTKIKEGLMIWVVIGMYALGALLAASTAQEISGTIRGTRQAIFIVAWPGMALVFAADTLWNWKK